MPPRPAPLLRRVYDALPLSPGMRHRIGLWRNAWLRRGKAAPMHRLEHGSAPQINLPPATAGLRDYLFWGVIDWHFRHQRPQQLALSIARTGRRVFYVSVNFVEDAKPGFTVENLHPDWPIYQIFLHVRGPLNIYSMEANPTQHRQLQEGLRDLWQAADIRSAVSVIQHPFWHALAGAFPAARTVYDCMDHHAGFSNTASVHQSLERQLMTQADLTVVTSDYLADAAQPVARRTALIRNAGDFEHFHQAAGQPARRDRPVIGYYGAIAEWFDIELMDALARQFPHCDFRLIGADSVGAGHALRHHRNIQMLGEKPYGELPQWLKDFDVCLIPFRVNDLTLATNPVKAYEYLSAGKAVVSTDLPEMQQFGDLVYRATGIEAFCDGVQQALDERGTSTERPALRMALARQQTWEHRAQDFIRAAENCAGEPSVSVVVVCYNQWTLTQRCLDSLEQNTDGTPLQIIAVDNASADETAERLRAWSAAAPERRVAVLNAKNLGFSGGVNSGMAHASGDYLVVLNNDTIVSHGWARGLRRHLEADPELGLVCPVTNNIGNEAQVALAGSTPSEVFRSARHYCLARTGATLPLTVAAFFCVMMPRTVWLRTGPMDERFFPGYFEDDDYCRRLATQGLKVGCAEDVFVYHELSATFDKEGQTRRQQIFAQSKQRYEEKWGPWTPHVYRAESLPR